MPDTPQGRMRGGTFDRPPALGELRGETRERLRRVLRPFAEFGRAIGEGWQQFWPSREDWRWLLEQFGADDPEHARRTLAGLGFEEREVDAIMRAAEAERELRDAGPAPPGPPGPPPGGGWEARAARGPEGIARHAGRIDPRTLTPEQFMQLEGPAYLWPSAMAQPGWAQMIEPAAQALRQRLGREPTPAEVAAEIGAPPGTLKHTEDSVHALFDMAREDVVQLQRELERVGLLERPYIPGHVDQGTADAYREALGWSNYLQGMGLERTLDELDRMTIADPAVAEEFVPQRFQAPVYEAPDPAAVAQSLKQLWRERLGRDLSPGEEAQFAQAFGGFHREAHDAAVDFQRQLHEREEWERRQGHRRATEPAPLDSFERAAQLQRRGPAPGVPTETVAVDPQARFAEFFEQRMGPEMREGERRAEAFHQRASLEDGLRAMSAGVGTVPQL